MKKKIYLGGGIALCGILAIIIVAAMLQTKLVSVSYKDYQNKLASKETFVLYLGSKDCSHCKTYKPTLNKVVRDYKLKVYYLDVSTLTEEEYAKVENKTHLKGTPTVAFFKDGIYQTSPKIQGEASYKETVNAFKESGYIK